MATSDPPRTPDELIARTASPDLVRVGRTGGHPMAIAGVVAAGLLLALAVWKPWEGSVAKRPAATPVADGAAGPIPAVTDRAGASDARRSAARTGRPDIRRARPVAHGDGRPARRLGRRGRLRLADAVRHRRPRGPDRDAGRQLGADRPGEAMAGFRLSTTGGHDRRDRGDMAERHPAERYPADPLR